MEDKNALSCIGLAAVVLLIPPLTSFLNGWVLTILWTWFIVPFWHVAPLRIWPAAGLALIVSYLTHNNSVLSKDDSLGKAIGTIVMRPFITLAFAWFIHWMAR